VPADSSQNTRGPVFASCERSGIDILLCVGRRCNSLFVPAQEATGLESTRTCMMTILGRNYSTMHSRRAHSPTEPRSEEHTGNDVLVFL
jgi:hypothetical protein